MGRRHRRAAKPQEKLDPSLNLYSVGQVAALLGYHVQHVYKLIREGKMAAVRIGGRTVRVRHETIKSLMVATEEASPRKVQNRRERRLNKESRP